MLWTGDGSASSSGSSACAWDVVESPLMGNEMGFSRRNFFRGVGAAAGAATLARGGKAFAEATPTTAQSRAVTEFFEPLSEQRRLGRWYVEAVHEVHLGAVPVVLCTTSGERFQVDVLRKGSVAGVADSEHYSLFLSNEGNGRSRSSEEHGLGLMALADWIRSREEDARLPPLLDHQERLQLHPSGSFRVTER